MIGVRSAPFLVVTPLGDELDPSCCARCQSSIGLWSLGGAHDDMEIFIPYAVLYSEADDGDMGYCLECADAVSPLADYASRRYEPAGSIDDLVTAAIINARINGYGKDIDGMTAHEFAIDLCSYNSELEKYEVTDVEAAVVRYRLRIGADLP